jgi:hypothetical protein
MYVWLVWRAVVVTGMACRDLVSEVLRSGGGCARAVATRDTDIEKCLRASGRVIYFEASYSIALCVPTLPHIA